MPSWSAIEAYEAGYERGLRDGQRRRVAADIRQQQALLPLPAGHTAVIIDWTAARRSRRLPDYGHHDQAGGGENKPDRRRGQNPRGA